jgi:pyridoxal phosphate enzyme (YggS family)
MSINITAYNQIINECKSAGVTLVAVSKTKPNEDIMAFYDMGHRDFGENYVQELTSKSEALPKDIRWHFIGHLQSNKVKYIAPFVHLIHGVDSEKLLREIDKQALKNNRIINCLLQIHIAKEETKFGLDEAELKFLLNNIASLTNIHIDGLMGMASFSDDMTLVRNELKYLRSLFDQQEKTITTNCKFSILSMGMSADYKIAIEEGSTMVRIGSMLFGARQAAP